MFQRNSAGQRLNSLNVPAVIRVAAVRLRTVRIAGALALCFLACAPALAATPCCGVTDIAANGQVTAREIDGTRTILFQVTDRALLRRLKPGAPVYANFETGQVSLDGRKVCCKILKTGTAAKQPATVIRGGGTVRGEQTTEPATAETLASAAPTQIADDVPLPFDPRAHGFEFTNYYTGDILVDLPGIGWVDLGNTSYGLCGGMVLSAFDTFNLDANAPDTPTNPPASGTPMRSYLYERQMDSLRRDNWFVVNRLVLWMRKPLKDQTVPNPAAKGGENVLERGLITLSRRQFRNKILPELKRTRPVPIVLVKASGEDLLTKPKEAFTKNHQVLAIGYREVDDNDWEIDIYDPNFPNTIQTLHTKGRYQTERGDSERTGKFRGYFVAPYKVERPPWVPQSEAIASRLRSVPVVTVSQTESDD